MQFFKHYVTARHSKSLAKFEAETGFEGLGRYWRLLEFLQEKFDGEDYQFTIHRQVIRDLFRIHSWSKLNSFVIHLNSIRGLDIDRIGNEFHFKARILLELQARSFKTQRVVNESSFDKNKKQNKIKIKNENKIKILKKTKAKKSQTDFDFENLYALYPKKEGKKEGLLKLEKIIYTQELYDRFQDALLRYKTHCEKTIDSPRYIKKFSTFVNNWEDWDSPEAGKVTLNLKAQQQMTHAQRVSANNAALFERSKNGEFGE